MRMNQALHISLTVAPAKVTRGSEALTQAGEAIATLGRPLVVGAHPAVSQPRLQQVLNSSSCNLTSLTMAAIVVKPVWQDCDRQRQHMKLM